MGLQRETAGRGTTAIYTKVTVTVVFFFLWRVLTTGFHAQLVFITIIENIFFDFHPSSLDGDRNDHNRGFGAVYSGRAHVSSAALLWY